MKFTPLTSGGPNLKWHSGVPDDTPINIIYAITDPADTLRYDKALLIGAPGITACCGSSYLVFQYATPYQYLLEVVRVNKQNVFPFVAPAYISGSFGGGTWADGFLAWADGINEKYKDLFDIQIEVLHDAAKTDPMTEGVITVKWLDRELFNKFCKEGLK